MIETAFFDDELLPIHERAVDKLADIMFASDMILGTLRIRIKWTPATVPPVLSMQRQVAESEEATSRWNPTTALAIHKLASLIESKASCRRQPAGPAALVCPWE